MFKNVHQSSEPHQRFTFEIHNVDLAIINGIRRVMLTDIPVIGFQGEEIGDTLPSLNVLANNGPLNNEIILHRFGLIPIHFSEEDTDSYDEKDYTFEIKADNQGQAMMNVTTEQMKVQKHGKEINPSKLFPANAFTKDHILITRLSPQEKLHVQGRAIKRTARLHAGFSPVSLCTMSFMGPAAAGPVSPLDKERAFYKNTYGEPTAVLFSIEAEMALTPQYLVRKALEIIVDKLETLVQSELIPTRTDNGAEFTIMNEDDTLGNVLQSNMHNYYMREGNGTRNNKQVSFVGYFCPHPLEACVVLRVCIQDHPQVPSSEYSDVVVDSCERLIAELRGILAEWNNVSM
jgi:DNA-directed RNA polymerase subunit L